MTHLRWRSPICGFLRFSAKIFGFLRKSAVFCGFLRPPNAGISRRRGESANENLRFSARICGFLGFLCHLRSVTLSSPEPRQSSLTSLFKEVRVFKVSQGHIGPLYQESPRQTKPKKGPKRKVHEFRPFLWILLFFLRKTSTIHIEFLFRNAPRKSSWTGLSLVRFAGVTPDSRKPYVFPIALWHEIITKIIPWELFFVIF